MARTRCRPRRHRCGFGSVEAGRCRILSGFADSFNSPHSHAYRLPELQRRERLGLRVRLMTQTSMHLQKRARRSKFILLNITEMMEMHSGLPRAAAKPKPKFRSFVWLLRYNECPQPPNVAQVRSNLQLNSVNMRPERFQLFHYQGRPRNLFFRFPPDVPEHIALQDELQYAIFRIAVCDLQNANGGIK